MQPMLAKPLDFDKLRYPVHVSPKLDGIRMVIDDSGTGRSRTWKAIPNQYIQNQIRIARRGLFPVEWLDGEIIVGKPNHPNVMQASMSGVMSVYGIPDFTYYIFDVVGSGSYEQRLKDIQSRALPSWIKVLPQSLCHTRSEVETLEAMSVEQGYEGVVVRSRDKFGRDPYKFGRSTVNEGYLLKLKRFTDAEALVVGVQELMHNENEAYTDAQGHTARTAHQDGKVPGNMLGALVVKHFIGGYRDGDTVIGRGVSFNIGTGFSMDDRIGLWKIRDSLPGRIVKYKSQPHGVLDAPRFPVFLGFRDVIDL